MLNLHTIIRTSLEFENIECSCFPVFDSILFSYLYTNSVNRTEAQKDIHRASLMWSPLKEDEQKQKEGIDYTYTLLEFVYHL